MAYEWLFSLASSIPHRRSGRDAYDVQLLHNGGDDKAGRSENQSSRGDIYAHLRNSGRDALDICIACPLIHHSTLQLHTHVDDKAPHTLQTIQSES